jgi:hypothetical protein
MAFVIQTVRAGTLSESQVTEIKTFMRHTLVSAFDTEQKHHPHAKFISDILSIQFAP